jgi:Ser-Thr-rich glycosyl-phosphatidyl-inositol-anchored membrane family
VQIKRVGTPETSDQTITISNPTAITLAEFSPTTVEPGQQLALDWEISGGSESTVDISLVRGGGDPQPISVARKVGGGRGIVTIPKAAPSGTYTLKVATTEKYGTAKTQLSATRPITIVAPTIGVATSTSSVKNGATLEITWDYGKGSTLPVKLELFKGSAAKAVLVIAKEAPSNRVDPASRWWHEPSEDGGGSLVWTVPAGLAAGTDYVVRATVAGVKPAVSVTSSAFTVTAPAVTVTDAPYEGGVVHGQTVPVTWTSDSGVAQNVSVVLLKGTKTVAKLSTKELTENGSGAFTWTVADKLVEGADYKVRVTDNDVPTRTDDSAVFSIGPNPTTLG